LRGDVKTAGPVNTLLPVSGRFEVDTAPNICLESMLGSLSRSHEKDWKSHITDREWNSARL
jgi:hypothetical protein